MRCHLVSSLLFLQETCGLAGSWFEHGSLILLLERDKFLLRLSVTLLSEETMICFPPTLPLVSLLILSPPLFLS